MKNQEKKIKRVIIEFQKQPSILGKTRRFTSLAESTPSAAARAFPIKSLIFYFICFSCNPVEARPCGNVGQRS